MHEIRHHVDKVGEMGEQMTKKQSWELKWKIEEGEGAGQDASEGRRI